MAIFYQSLQKFPSAQTVCIIVHGLNNKPDALTDIAELFEAFRIPVITVGLTGHNEDFERLKSINEITWHNDVLQAYKLSARKNAKILLVAYSLGATISLDILSNNIKFDKMVLLAPAIAPRKPVQLLGSVAGKFPAFPLYSIVPEKYRANPYLPLKAYDVLFQLYKSLKKKRFSHANVPTLVVIDPKDETMSLEGIKLTIEKCHLNQWSILALDSDHVNTHTRFHHMILDRETMGDKNWQLFVQHVKDFLKT